MKAVEFVGQALVLNPPGDMKRGECGGLPVARYVPPVVPYPTYSSFWRPSPEDLAALNAGAHVRLDVLAVVHPPVAMSVERVSELP